MSKKKPIDIVDIKREIREGNIKVGMIVRKNRYQEDRHYVTLVDNITGETVCIWTDAEDGIT